MSPSKRQGAPEDTHVQDVAEPEPGLTGSTSSTYKAVVPSDWSKDMRELWDRANTTYVATRARLDRTIVGRIWGHLQALGFWSSSLRFAAVFTLFFVPFLLLASAIVGLDFSRSVADRSGFSRQAAHDLNSLFVHGRTPVSLTVIGVILLVNGADTMAAILQEWYGKVFGQVPVGWVARISRIRWLGGVIAFVALQAVISRRFEPIGGGAATRVLQLLLAFLFWWWSLHCLLGGQVSWRRVIPAGVATTVCYAGVGLYIQFFVSSNIVSSEASYGPVGVVMTLLTVLVGLGVALHIGAVVGADFGETWRSLRHSTR